MSFFRRLITKIFQWEYWPFWVFNLPVNFYFIWLALKERSFFFFAASNPTIDFGGMIGEKKSEIFNLIPQEYYPKTILIDNHSADELKQVGLSVGYPFVAKPDIGERGNGVEVIRTEEDLLKYRSGMPVPFLVQEFANYPVELGVFYVRKPSEEMGKVTSIVQKKLLSVTGNGESTVRELLKSQIRASLQVDFEHTRLTHLLDKVPTLGEEIVVEEIGNHCRGTMFLDATFEADARLNEAFDRLAKQIDGFYYGRFDLKCRSFDDLRELKNFKIVELNGCGAEPAHIYQPGFSLMKAYGVVWVHFKWMAEVSRENKKLGTPYLTTRQGLKKLADLRGYNKQLRGA